MNTLEKLKKKRFLFMNRLYEISGGDRHKVFDEWKDICEVRNFSESECETISQYLEGEGLIKWVAQGGAISITHRGVMEVEEALTEPEQSTNYFPPVINIINVHHMEGSQIQQGSYQSTQSVSFSHETQKSLQEFIELLKEKLPNIQIAQDDRSEIQADISTIEAQINSIRPKPSIIKESLSSIQRVLESTTAGIIAGELLKYLPALFAALQV
ncbi:MAG: hypothetical protein AB1401_06060 [Thermodesulfobacteriota bacterium]